MEHILVCWIDEVPIKFTVMQRKDIVDGTKRLMEKNKLLHQVVTFSWKKRIYNGKIMRFGELTKVNHNVRIIIDPELYVNNFGIFLMAHCSIYWHSR